MIARQIDRYIDRLVRLDIDRCIRLHILSLYTHIFVVESP